MTDRPITPMDELVADYVRSTMRVEVPEALADDVMRSVASAPQARRSWFAMLPPYAPAIAAVTATILVIAVGLFLVAPRSIGPPADATPTPAPTLTPENARVLTEPSEEIRIPALDGDGQFATITIRRGEERSGYEGFVPLAFEDVFFVELYVKYEPERATSEEYGEWEFAYAVDLEGDGFVDEEVRRGVGFLGLEGQPGYDSAPQPILQGKRSGDEVLEGWLVLELPAAAADFDLYLVYGHGEWTDGIQNMRPDESALLRRPGEPVGVTAFDPNASPSSQGSPSPITGPHGLPSPLPSPAATFEPSSDAGADALFDATESCTNVDLGLIVTYPASWYTNEPLEDFPACALFGPEPIDEEVVLRELGNSLILITQTDSWSGGVEQPQVELVPIVGRLAWHISWAPDQRSSGTIYLLPRTDDPYGPFVSAGAGSDEAGAVLERILIRLQLTE